MKVAETVERKCVSDEIIQRGLGPIWRISSGSLADFPDCSCMSRLIESRSTVSLDTKIIGHFGDAFPSQSAVDTAAVYSRLHINDSLQIIALWEGYTVSKYCNKRVCVSACQHISETKMSNLHQIFVCPLVASFCLRVNFKHYGGALWNFGNL